MTRRKSTGLSKAGVVTLEHFVARAGERYPHFKKAYQAEQAIAARFGSTLDDLPRILLGRISPDATTLERHRHEKQVTADMEQFKKVVLRMMQAVEPEFTLTLSLARVAKKAQAT